MYLTYGIRPNIAFVIGQLSKQNADPRKEQLKVTKRVVGYQKDMIYMGIMYRQTSNNPLPYGLNSYANNNFAGNPTDRKLIIEYYFFLNEAMVL